MAELEMTETTEPTEKREQSLLNLICYIGAGLFLALVAYNLFAAGSVISTDGLFFTVVPLFLALCFLVVPGMDMLAKRKAAKAAEASGEAAGTAHTSYRELTKNFWQSFPRRPTSLTNLVELIGFEPTTSALQGRRSPN